MKAAIFDLDGVIVDTAKYHYTAWKEIAEELGINFNHNDNEKLKGVSRERSLEILLEIGNIKIDNEKFRYLAHKKNSNYLDLISELTPDDCLPGVKDYIYKLKECGWKIALGSASKNAQFILEKLEILEMFDSVMDGTKIEKAKPDPEVFLKASDDLNIAPENCVVFEDAVSGVKAGKKAGMTVVGVGDKDRLNEADFVITDFKSSNLEKLKL